jgi:purine-cytosine permease-like protein
MNLAEEEKALTATSQTDPGAPSWGAHEPEKVTEIESFGIETIPPEDRTATPFDLFRVEFGGANTFATVVLGAFPVLVFGLGFWDAMLAALLGIVVGGLILMPMALFGPINGTNNAVSSGAHFGVVGRIVGSFLALLVAIAFFAISIFTSGDILVGALDDLFGTGRSDALVAVAYAVFAVAILAICIYGFRFMLSVNKVAVLTATLLYLLGAIAYGGDLKTSYGGFAEGAAFLPAFIGSALLVLSNPLSFGAYLGDWSRYIPATASRRKLLLAAFGAQLATIIPFGFGIATATVIATNAPDAAKAGDYAGGLIQVTPGWFLVPVAVIAIIGGLSTGTTSLYGTGLDFSSVFPRLSRVQSTTLIGIIAIAVVFMGKFALNFVDTIVTFATLIIVCTTPWVIIMTIGFLQRRGHYLPDHLQVFNRGQRGGAYWFHRGVNWRGMAAWIPAAAVGLLFVNLPGQFEGPLRNVASDIGISGLAGVDISLLVAMVLSASLYVLFIALFPEPREVFGPDGPRWFRAAESKAQPIQLRDSAVREPAAETA